MLLDNYFKAHSPLEEECSCDIGLFLTVSGHMLYLSAAFLFSGSK